MQQPSSHSAKRNHDPAATSPYLVGDVVIYTCNGNLVPAVETVSMCTAVSGGAQWEFSATTQLPECGKKFKYCSFFINFQVIYDAACITCSILIMMLYSELQVYKIDHLC